MSEEKIKTDWNEIISLVFKVLLYCALFFLHFVFVLKMLLAELQYWQKLCILALTWLVIGKRILKLLFNALNNVHFSSKLATIVRLICVKYKNPSKITGDDLV